MVETKSFSTLQKENIIAERFKSMCCRKALLAGALYTRANISDSNIILTLSGKETIDFLSKLIFEIYGKEPCVDKPRYGGRAIILSFKSPACEKYIYSLAKPGALFDQRCPKCRAAFLKGCFLAAGRVADPAKQFLMEFSFLDDEVRISPFLDLLSENGIEARYMRRNKERIVYVKKIASLEAFFAECEMNNAYFSFFETKINKQLRNEANRRVNCEINNITRAVNASQSQIAVITEMDARGLLSSLPEELERTARLRILHKDLSLSDLAKLSVPPISKSGLSHRLAKIMEIGQKILD